MCFSASDRLSTHASRRERAVHLASVRSVGVVVDQLVEFFLLVEDRQHVVRPLVREIGSGREPAAVDDDVGAGDVGGLVGGEEEGGVADLLGLAAAAQQYGVVHRGVLHALHQRVGAH